MRALPVAVFALSAFVSCPAVWARAAGPPVVVPSIAPQLDAASTPETFKALGPMPPDTELAAQATWRIRHYDLEIESDHRVSDRNARSVQRERAMLERYKSDNPDDPKRLHILTELEGFSALQNLSELHAQAAAAAKMAVGHAESVRLAVAAGSHSASDLADARAKASKAEHLAQAARQALLDKSMALLQANLALGSDLPAPWAHAQAAGLRLGDVVAAQERARLEGLAYGEVRDAVEAGKRPASDLEAARQSLKAAQVVVYDQLDIMMKANGVLLTKLREDAARRVVEMEIRVAAQEKDLPPLGSEARAQAEERLRMNKEILEAFKSSEAVSVRIAATPPRPELPILPPRS